MVATIEAAVASLAASLPDASMRMRHGDAEGVVLASSSRQLSEDTVTADAPQEMRRVIGRRCDFPELVGGCAVELAGAWHIVTSARTDPVGASVSVGLSAPLDEIAVTYRRPGTQIRQPLRVLAVESAVLDPNGDGFAPTTCRAWFVAFPSAHWLEATDPQVGDEVVLDGRRLVVASVTKNGGYWLAGCRSRR